MRRRNFIGGLTSIVAAAALPATVSARNGSGLRVAVVGAGIVGASIAYHLARRGCDVVVIDKRGPATQASGNSFAWVNASYVKTPLSYHLLSTYGVNEWRRLANELPIPIRFGGSLEWVNSESKQAELMNGVRQMQAWGSPTAMISLADAQALEPQVQFGDPASVAWCRQDAAIDPATTTNVLLEAAVAEGATLMMPANVTDIVSNAKGVVIQTSEGDVSADRVAVAAGVGATELAALIDLPLPQRSTPGLIVTTERVESQLNGVIVAPGCHVHQRRDGRIILGEQGGPPTVPAHADFLAGRPNRYPSDELAMQHARRLVDIAEPFVPALWSVEIESVGIGWRPLPLDGLPVVGKYPQQENIHFAVMHSGVTLAPVIGRLTAAEIIDNVAVELLDDFRPARF